MKLVEHEVVLKKISTAFLMYFNYRYLTCPRRLIKLLACNQVQKAFTLGAFWNPSVWCAMWETNGRCIPLHWNIRRQYLFPVKYLSLKESLWLFPVPSLSLFPTPSLLSQSLPLPLTVCLFLTLGFVLLSFPYQMKGCILIPLNLKPLSRSLSL